MAANSKFDVCSQAFQLLGLGTINSFSGGGKEAIANSLYDTTIMSLIESYPWHFARVIAEPLNRLTETPENAWTYYYQLPSNISGGVVALYDQGGTKLAPNKDWERVGEKIATDLTEVWIHHSAIPEVAKWPGYFTLLAVFALAGVFAQPAKESKELSDFWTARAFGPPQESGKGGQWALATAADARGSPSTVQRDNPFIDCR